MKSLDLLRRIDLAVDQLNSCSYLLLRRQAITGSLSVAQSVKTPAPLFSVAGRSASTWILSSSLIGAPNLLPLLASLPTPPGS